MQGRHSKLGILLESRCHILHGICALAHFCHDNLEHIHGPCSYAGESGVKKLSKAVDSAVGNIGSILVDHLQPSLQSAAFKLNELHSLAKCTHQLQPLGLQARQAAPLPVVTSASHMMLHILASIVVVSDKVVASHVSVTSPAVHTPGASSIAGTSSHVATEWLQGCKHALCARCQLHGLEHCQHAPTCHHVSTCIAMQHWHLPGCSAKGAVC